MGFTRVVDDVRDDQIRAQEAVVRQQHLAFERLHANAGGIGQDHAAVDFGAQLVMIVEIEKVDLAVGVIADLGHGLLGIGEELVFAVEDRDGLHAVERGLYADGGSRAACAEDGHLFADDIDTSLRQRAHIAGAVGNVAG